MIRLVLVLVATMLVGVALFDRLGPQEDGTTEPAPVAEPETSQAPAGARAPAADIAIVVHDPQIRRPSRRLLTVSSADAPD